MSCPSCAGKPQGLEELVRTAVRDVLRQELPRAIAELHQAPAPDDLLDLKHAAKRLGLGTSTVRKLAAKCELPSMKSGRRLLFAPADLDAYAASRRRSPERVRKLASGADEGGVDATRAKA
jgi:excisionase family DNA binding protein